ncbi:hypothetical protein TD95_001689 [Thielaviopsis punctulata]|uniref:Smr domain-containing protein n=1 Tax=Thielaviopsis punctulata TaxID=72032 RepID=A0A0F4Z891_9PEZI|nr:hypothetical protein TD95_001689 [Thielaviopsis punctulata]
MAARVDQRHQRTFHHNEDGQVEAEYDRLRGLAHSEASERNKCFQQSREAYENGDGAAAKELSNKGKRHARNMDDYNRQASEYIFAENNAPGRVQEDEIDLHGQYVEEAQRIVEKRLKSDRAAGKSRLCVIVGKGIHSNRQIPKIKPTVEEVLDRMGLDYHTDEHNAGRIIVKLNEGVYVPSQKPHYSSGGQHQPQHGNDSQQQPEEGQSLLGTLFSVIEKKCCAVM